MIVTNTEVYILADSNPLFVNFEYGNNPIEVALYNEFRLHVAGLTNDSYIRDHTGYKHWLQERLRSMGINGIPLFTHGVNSVCEGILFNSAEDKTCFLLQMM